MKTVWIITTETTKMSVNTFFELEEHGYIGKHTQLDDETLHCLEIVCRLASKFAKTTKQYKEGFNGEYSMSLQWLDNIRLLRKYLRS